MSPSVGGPIAGVEITAPRVVQPGDGTKLRASELPITLMVENSSSNGVRPVTYAFEVSSDTNFEVKQYARYGVEAGGDGRTRVTVGALDTGRQYFWRVRAEDGANSSLYSTARFEVLPKPQLDPPPQVSPLNNEQTSVRPTLVVGASSRNAAIGNPTYEFQIAADGNFVSLVAAGSAAESGDRTSWAPSGDLNGSTTYFWRVRAVDIDVTSLWSNAQFFRTSSGGSPAPGPGPAPSGNWRNCGSTPGDELVECVHAAVNPARTEEGAFEVTKRVAWLLRGSGGGLLIKRGGENIVSWLGESYSAGRICFPDGHIYKVLSDIPTTNGPSWQDNGFVDRSLYVPAIDPDR